MIYEEKIKGHKLTYEIHSKGKEDILLFNGWASFQFFWSHLIEELKPYGRVITADIMGHYPATFPEGLTQFSLEEWTHIQAELIKKITKKKVTLIGHSAGGMVSISLAAMYPKLIKKLICITPAVHGPVEGFLYPIKLGFEMRLGRLITEVQKLLLIPEFSMQLFFNIAVHDKENFFSQKGIQEFLKVYHKHFQKLDFENMGNYLLSVDKFDTRPLASQIQQPCLLFVGMHDHIVPSSHGLELSRILPNVECILFEKSGHIPTLEEKEKAVFHLKRFLENKKILAKKNKTKIHI